MKCAEVCGISCLKGFSRVSREVVFLANISSNGLDVTTVRYRMFVFLTILMCYQTYW